MPEGTQATEPGAVEALMEHAELSRAAAELAVTAIARGQVPSVKITY